jgi:hypothetical protein
MNAVKKAKLEAAGYTVGTTAEFLQLSLCEAEIVETRIALSKMVKTLRAQSCLTQAELAAKVNTGQARIARMEAADPTISTDALLKTLYTLGANRKQVAEAIAA